GCRISDRSVKYAGCSRGRSPPAGPRIEDVKELHCMDKLFRAGTTHEPHADAVWKWLAPQFARCQEFRAYKSFRWLLRGFSSIQSRFSTLACEASSIVPAEFAPAPSTSTDAS